MPDVEVGAKAVSVLDEVQVKSREKCTLCLCYRNRNVSAWSCGLMYKGIPRFLPGLWVLLNYKQYFLPACSTQHLPRVLSHATLFKRSMVSIHSISLAVTQEASLHQKSCKL